MKREKRAQRALKREKDRQIDAAIEKMVRPEGEWDVETQSALEEQLDATLEAYEEDRYTFSLCDDCRRDLYIEGKVIRHYTTCDLCENLANASQWNREDTMRPFVFLMRRPNLMGPGQGPDKARDEPVDLPH